MTSPSKSQRKGKVKVNQALVVKAHWDEKNNEIFIKLCVHQVVKGNRPGTHINIEGWNVILKKFHSATGKLYNKIQLKNHWDNLKKEWGLWNSLVRGESGLGRDPVTGAITASDEWWKNKLERYPAAIKFRTKPLQYVDDLDIMFNDVTATGEFAYAPNSGQMPFMETSHSEEPYTNLEDDNLNEMGEMELTHPSELTKKRSSGEGPSNQRKGQKQSNASKLSRTLNRIIDAVETSSATSVGCTIAECLEKLGNIPGVSEEDDIYVWAARLFFKDKYRELFMALRTDDLRMRCLNLEIALEKTHIPGFSTSF